MNNSGNGTAIIGVLTVPAGGVIPFEHDGVVYYTMSYKMCKEKTWDLGALRQLQFYIVNASTGATLATPYPFKVLIDLKLIHVSG